MHDFKYALRTFIRQPIFSLIAVLTLTAGIGANTAIFSLFYHVLLRPLPYPHGGRLVLIWNTALKQGAKPMHVSIPDYLDRLAAAPAIEDATLYATRTVALLSGEQPEQLNELMVTPSFFTTFKRTPMLGRAFTAEDAKPDADRFVILTHDLWTSHFAADPGVIGRKLRIDGVEYLTTGVLPADFELPARKVSLLVPFSFRPAQMTDRERGNEFSLMAARLRPGATVEQLNVQMDAIVARLIERLPARAAFMRNSGFAGRAASMHEQLAREMRTSLYLLQGGVIVVLLIACANVANLLLMRASGRQRELAIRMALGAGRRHILRQLLIEGALLSTAGAIGGILLAAAGARALIAMTADQLPETPPAVIHPAVLAFTIGVTVLTTLIFAVVPALSVLRGNRAPALNEETSRGSTGRRTGAMRTSLVIVETALAVVLLAAAGLLVKGFVRLIHVDPGFSMEHVLTAQLSLPRARYREDAARRVFWQRLIEKTKETPGVTAGLITGLPFSGKVGSGSYSVAGRVLGPTEKLPHARIDQVGGDYFRAMGIALVAGEVFDKNLSPESPPVVVIDEFLAKRQFPGQSAVQQALNFGDEKNYRIIGVVRTINDLDLSQPVPEERIYFSLQQGAFFNMALAIKTAQDPASIVAKLRSDVQSLDPEQAIAEVRTMDQWVDRSLNSRRTPMTLLVVFGLLALTLAAIGTYGVLAFSVAQRSRELGIRQALGADRQAILALILGQGLRTTCAGIVVGLAASVAATRYMQSMLFGVQPHDLSVLAGAAISLLAVAAAACYIPARRATRVDPAVALRDL